MTATLSVRRARVVEPAGLKAGEETGLEIGEETGLEIGLETGLAAGEAPGEGFPRAGASAIKVRNMIDTSQ